MSRNFSTDKPFVLKWCVGNLIKSLGAFEPMTINDVHYFVVALFFSC